MAYTAPKTFAANAVLTASELNTYVRDNTIALKAPPTDLYNVNEGADYTTASTSFADVDGTDLSLTITTTGGDVMIVFDGTVSHDTTGARVYFDVYYDSSTYLGGDDGMFFEVPNSGGGVTEKHVSFMRILQGLSAGSHTFNLRWKVSAGNVTMYAGAGTSNKDVHPQFWVREG